MFNFNIAGQVPANATIASATLSVWVYQLLDFDSNDWVDIGPYAVLRYRTWTESQATWNRFAGSTYWSVPGCEGVGTDRNALPDSTLRFTRSSAINRYYDWDVTATVRAWYLGNAQNNGWLMRIAANDGAGGEGISFNGKESAEAYRPYLTINYTVPPIPEPSSLLILGTGLASLTVLRRRR